MINNIKDYNKIGLNPYIKFSIVLILIYVFRTQYWFNELIHNFGLPDLRFTKAWLFYIPGTYIMLDAYFKRKNHVINLVPFSIQDNHTGAERRIFGS